MSRDRVHDPNGVNSSTEQRLCSDCGGAGCLGLRRCWLCLGRGWFYRPDAAAILKALRPTRGKNVGGVRAVPPRYGQDLFSRRVYYVWRMYQQLAGLDHRQPAMAQILTAGDPWRNELRGIAEALAKEAREKKS